MGLLMTKVFVYGTLKSGRHNNYLLQSSRLLGEFITEQPCLLTTVGFPYLIPKDCATAASVLGEVYEVDDGVMEDLDCLEGVSYNHYKRESMRVVGISDGVECEVIAYVPCDLESAEDYPLCEKDERNYYVY